MYALLADPGPASWVAICKLLDVPGPRGHEASEAVVLADAVALKRELRSWPPEVERPAPSHWYAARGPLAEARRALVREVREVDLYELYCQVARDSPLLRLHDGTPAVRLQRNFRGTLQGAHGRTVSIGVDGQADLCGSLCVEWFDHADPDHAAAALEYSKGRSSDPGDPPVRRLGVSLEVEVKRDCGTQSKDQVKREAALRRRGEVYICVKRTEEMVRLLITERARLSALLGGIGWTP